MEEYELCKHITAQYDLTKDEPEVGFWGGIDITGFFIGDMKLNGALEREILRKYGKNSLDGRYNLAHKIWEELKLEAEIAWADHKLDELKHDGLRFA